MKLLTRIRRHITHHIHQSRADSTYVYGVLTGVWEPYYTAAAAYWQRYGRLWPDRT